MISASVVIPVTGGIWTMLPTSRKRTKCISAASRSLSKVGNGTPRSKLMDAAESDHYGQCAYRSDVISPQKNQVELLKQTGLDQLGSLPLPRGQLSKLVQLTLMTDDLLKKRSGFEKKQDLADELVLLGEHNDDCFRYVLLAFQARFIDMRNELE